ncbi:MAG: 50S ribosomal protein L17 [Bacteroidota bacterium]
MRHRKSGRKLKRTASHRSALLRSLSTSLLRHKRITTTVAKAKETRMVVEKIITRARNAMAKSADAPAAAIHARREVGRMIKDRKVITELFSTIVEKIGTRPGGYTRIVRLGQRPGDGAELAVIELVDFNTGSELTGRVEAEKKSSQPKKFKKSGTTRKEKPAAKKDEAVTASASSSV